MSSIAGRTLGPTSDLVVRVPWRDGIIGADEAVLPATRFALTFRAIFQIRRAAREATELPAFSDPIERLEQVHSFRLAAQPEGMLLAVTYDFAWESYMRALWRDGGPFLDLLLCNCKDYRLARDIDLGAWSAWVKTHEIAVDYFYAAYPLTVTDLQGLAQAEVVQRDAGSSVEGDLKLAGFASRPADATAAEIRRDLPEVANAQGLRILTALHRLTRYYGADIAGATPLAADAETLLRATRAMLEGWDTTTLNAGDRDTYARELAWFEQRLPDASGPPPTPGTPDPANIQRGILNGFDLGGRAVSHGAVLHLMVDDPVRARRSLGKLKLATEAGGGSGVMRNIALSFAGLARLGVPAEALDGLPAPFREGAAARAGSVGDVRAHHPTRWQRLPRNWLPGKGFLGDRPGTIDLGIIDAVVQLHLHAPGRPTDLANPGHPLRAAIDGFAARFPGWVLLSVEALNPAHPDRPGIDHFGFRDGISQPGVGVAPGVKWSDAVPVSDLLLGYRGAPDDAALPLAGSSWMAIRRMPMRGAAFDAAIDAAAAKTGLSPDVIAAKIVGRHRDGSAPVPHHGDNDYDYEGDPDGALVPRQSHARRTNPRSGPLLSNGVPRIMRRGMGFGPPASGPFARDGERGSMFIAYCADLAEQYEVVLRWVNGANSSRIGSWLGDPLCGVPDAVTPHIFRFIHDGTVHRVALPVAAAAPVGLSWSMYLLVPSIDLVKRIAAIPIAIPAPARVDSDTLGKARRLVAGLLAKGAPEAEWRNWLDEPAAREAGMQAAVWQAIRDDHGGVLNTRDLVLVGRHDLIADILRDDGSRFSVRGAGRRIAASIEKFHLGLDADTPDYQREGLACNAAIARVSAANAFTAARTATIAQLQGLLADGASARVDVVRQLFEPALARMAPTWFGLPDGGFIAPGASDWRAIDSRLPMFPGDFWNSSRFAFNPFESSETARLSALHGQAILDAAHRWITATGRRNLTGNITRALARARSGVPGETGLAYPTDRDLARGVTGAMLGWVATTLGNGARLFDAWAGSATLQRQQLDWLATRNRTHTAARRVFDAEMKATIARAPVPECKWRTSVVATAIGGTPVAAHRKIILGLASASAECPRDSHIWFGQTPPGTPPAPHGCPGRDMALGVLLGMLAAVAETVLVRATGARLEIEISPLPDAAA